MSELQKLLTTSEVAYRLRVTRETLWRWRKEGKIKAVSTGGKLLYTEDEIKRFISDGMS